LYIACCLLLLRIAYCMFPVASCQLPVAGGSGGGGSLLLTPAVATHVVTPLESSKKDEWRLRNKQSGLSKSNPYFGGAKLVPSKLLPRNQGVMPRAIFLVRITVCAKRRRREARKKTRLTAPIHHHSRTSFGQRSPL
jgi:hypothetical protein